MSKGFYKNRRLKSFIFLSVCFLVAFIPHAYTIENFLYILFTLSLVIVFYGLKVISKNFKRNNVSNTVSSRISNQKLPVLDILVAARDEENVIARLVERLISLDYPTNKLNNLSTSLAMTFSSSLAATKISSTGNFLLLILLLTVFETLFLLRFQEITIKP